MVLPGSSELTPCMAWILPSPPELNAQRKVIHRAPLMSTFSALDSGHNHGHGIPMISAYLLQRAAPMNKHDRDNELFLVDGSGFIFRAYHALPPLNRPDGTPVN